MKLPFKIVVLIFFCMLIGDLETYGQNLLDMQGWTIGQGSSGVFNQNGSNEENVREWGEGPHGKRVLLWRSKPIGDGHDDGGWNSHPIPVNHNNMYRFTVWIKKTNSMNGGTFFGCQNVLNLANVPDNNPYFWNGNLPELNKWYLLVGYIHGSSDDSMLHYGGVYDGVTGAKVIDIADFKFVPGATDTYHRSYLFYDPNVNDRQFFYAPRIDLVNGNEPSVFTLLGLSGATAEVAYFPGKVGIKTPNPGNYELAVNGKMRTHEIRVETANWPDYVFEKSYALPELSETEKFIKENGHLSGIPSALEVKTNGIELADMNARLLKKIEELTLHLIEKEKELKRQNEKNEIRDARMDKLEKMLKQQHKN